MAKSKRAASASAEGLAHVVTIGTTPPGAHSDVVDALTADLKGLKPAYVSVVATPDSEANAKRLLKGIGMKAATSRIVLVRSHQSLDDAYQGVGEELDRLASLGFERNRVVLHYTAGTKVMAAGAVLAAVSHDVIALRYMAAGPKGKPSEPIETFPRAVIANYELNEATEFLFELRFSKAAQMTENVDTTLLSKARREETELVRRLAIAYDGWDAFRPSVFLSEYRTIAKELPKSGRLAAFRVKEEALECLARVAAAENETGKYPEEAIFELYNNALRRLRERRHDDALIRLYRAAELYAQWLLMTEYGLRTDNLDIRRVPPRNRTRYEAQRRLDDATIKLGLRDSYELLDILGHPVGAAFRTDREFQEVLHQRRDLVLAHGTKPCAPETAMAFLRELEVMFEITIPDFKRRAASQQFPFIDNAAVLAQLSEEQAELQRRRAAEAKKSAKEEKKAKPGKKSKKGGGRKR